MSPQSDASVLFTPLPKWRAPWYELVLSYGAQAVAIAILVWIPVLHPEILEPPKKDYHAIELVPTPVPVNHTPQKQLPKPVVEAKLDPPPVAAMRLPAPQPLPKPKVVEEAPVPEVKIATKKLDPLPATAPVIPRQAVKTNVFSTGSSAPQTTNRPPDQIQTGGFGDPNGVPARTTQTRAVNIASAGGFDMPSGPGYGNGTAGANGARGVVATQDSVTVWRRETRARLLRARFVSQDSVIRMCPLRRQFSPVRLKRRQRWSQLKFCPSQCLTTRKRRGRKRSKARCFSRWYSKHPANCVC